MGGARAGALAMAAVRGAANAAERTSSKPCAGGAGADTATGTAGEWWSVQTRHGCDDDDSSGAWWWSAPARTPSTTTRPAAIESQRGKERVRCGVRGVIAGEHGPASGGSSSRCRLC